MIHRRVRTALLATVSLGLSGCFALLLLAPKTTAEALPDRPGKKVYVQRCGNCHSLVDPASLAHRTEALLDRYTQQRIITQAERQALAAYLAGFGATAQGMAPGPAEPAPPAPDQPD